MNIKRTVTLRLLQLIRDLTNKAAEFEGVGIKLAATDELIEQVASTLFEINGIVPAAAGPLYISLSDYSSGAIEAADFMSLMHGQAVSLQ
ncbi:hypothetical protein SAMN04488542_10558 [Fontibacillus panacisegetis]|uniref:Uncharacterized protein n=1 Tax=Fontibacillus panacisegetis TaxID=670482 RepID=A0A1G7HW88_9BACL|nr:hypothetical protein [Fontibacillus panacisegetis]SDF04655.1 hypothetical protein SAMN04488542_10558 [Fontibacillus panacisegetis]